MLLKKIIEFMCKRALSAYKNKSKYHKNLYYTVIIEPE